MQKYATLLHGLKTELVHLSTKSKATRQMAHIQTNSVAEPQNRKKAHTTTNRNREEHVHIDTRTQRHKSTHTHTLPVKPDSVASASAPCPHTSCGATSAMGSQMAFMLLALLLVTQPGMAWKPAMALLAFQQSQ